MMDKQYYKSNFVNEEYLQNTIGYVLDEIFDLMRVSYGPYGSHVLIANKIGAEALKDGQRILSSYIPNSSIATSVIQSIKSVSNKQAEEVGDGTTTTILLLCLLYKRFRKIIVENNISPATFKKTLNKVVSDILTEIKYFKTDISDRSDKSMELLRNAVYTSVDANKELTDIIIDMFKEMNSNDPLVIVDTSTSENHTYELVKGVELDGAPISPEIFFNGYSRKNIDSPIIIMVNGRLELSVEYIMELDQLAMRSERDYVFLCNGINEDTLSTLITIKNANPSSLNRITFFQIKSSGLTDEFMDSCAALGVNPIDSDTLKKVSSVPALMKIIDINSSSAEKALVTEFCIRLNHPESNDDRVSERVEEINKQLEVIKNEAVPHNETIKILENRKAFLTKNFAKLYVGGESPQRRSINYELAKDGVLQVTSCLQNGVVMGANTFIPELVHDFVITVTDGDLYEDILNSIKECYYELFYTIIYNKIGKHDISDDIKLLERKDVNVRDDDDVIPYNSAATDITILKNATDMATLLATSKAFLSTIPEFDTLSNH